MITTNDIQAALKSLLIVREECERGARLSAGYIHVALRNLVAVIDILILPVMRNEQDEIVKLENQNDELTRKIADLERQLAERQ
jgi:hypothetical protein